MEHWDVVVVGGGHAGVEAANASARRGVRTMLCTADAATIGVMSCNPSIGGIGKGHIVREIDALDGVMARAADAAAIHHRMLNRSKGAAVQGPRVQADRTLYRNFVQAHLARESRITVRAAEVVDLVITRDRVTGVQLADDSFVSARAVVLATGTFLGGRIFRGEERIAGGRWQERAATALAQTLRLYDLPVGRLKTGTPPRLDGRSIDWGRLEEQASDRDSWCFSDMNNQRGLPQVACAITRTTSTTHNAIRRGLNRSPLFSGDIAGGGPRYCPSIEDKVHRFGDRDGHQVFLEPEGLDTAIVYPNGISTSLPVDVQHEVVASIPGLEQCRIVTPGYAVEYDYIDPRALDHRLASRAIPGLFCAGQINGTTGYEEAAGQGVVAGANAAAHACGLEPLLLDRASSYIGVMIDDLVLQGITEPYRMLTARAEYRLSLRPDNAATRLSDVGRRAGLMSDVRLAAVARQGRVRERLSAGAPLAAEDEPLRNRISAELAEDERYAPYVARQRQEIARLRNEETILLPAALRYDGVPGLSHEMRERLEAARPPSLAAAARVRGVTPAALTAVLLHVRRMPA